ncbi:unnamed protein product [Acanthoscelides obtectus]|uniref:Uncharacterized protein n=1 Tax=Acanthoscelides obtectus TaxID=200917 RepID=A0A9P0M7H6_ACAOB|nr:unnamed protein product [Acanthoscelides obtectus]CAH2010630.1 unnamed protein product [Acanthoscelides obtectus]CAK1672448.1 hypothetical protein AOBTE_LOCUS28900 [Acanthoscelides obtectus]CAK1672453.1 hypothetical protein AOBTE_LOCUS28905 [Acanthoscelides obtectus]
MITLYSRGYPPRRSKRLTGICILSDMSCLFQLVVDHH